MHIKLDFEDENVLLSFLNAELSKANKKGKESINAVIALYPHVLAEYNKFVEAAERTGEDVNMADFVMAWMKSIGFLSMLIASKCARPGSFTSLLQTMVMCYADDMRDQAEMAEHRTGSEEEIDNELQSRNSQSVRASRQ